MECIFFMFLDHTQRRSTVARTPLDEWSARRRDLYLTTHDTHNRPQAANTLRSWVRIPPRAWIFVCCECRVSSGRGLCDELFTRPEESYRLCCVVVCDLETSRIGAPYIYTVTSPNDSAILKNGHFSKWLCYPDKRSLLQMTLLSWQTVSSPNDSAILTNGHFSKWLCYPDKQLPLQMTLLSWQTVTSPNDSAILTNVTDFPNIVGNLRCSFTTCPKLDLFPFH
jgi:hypothetical protein